MKERPTILHVDDDPMILRAIERMLKDNYTIQTSENVVPPDPTINLLISDWNLGFGLTAEKMIREFEAEGIPVLVYSSSFDIPNDLRQIRKGDPHKLEEALAEVLGRESQ